MADEQIRLGIDFGPFAETAKATTREMEALNLKLDEQRRELERLDAAWQKGHIGSAAQYRTAQKEMQQEITATTRAIKVHQNELDNLGKKANTAATFGGSGQGMNQLAFALDDFMNSSGGFAQKLTGVSNNLQMFAMSMGVGGVWLLAVTGAIAGLKVLVSNWDKMASQLEGLPDPEVLKAAADKLQQQADKYKGAVDAMVAKPEPGTEGGQAKAKETVASVFVGRQAEQIRQGALSSALGFGGDYTGAEVAELGGAEAEAKRLAGMRAEEQEGIKNMVPGAMPTTSKEMVEAANAKVAEIKQRVATRTANRLMDQATMPGKAGKEARKRLAFMARQNPGAFPGGLAEKLADIDSSDTRAATEAMAAFGAEAEYEDLEMQLGFHGAPPPLRGFRTGVVPASAKGGVVPPGYGQDRFGGMKPGEFRERERERQSHNPGPNTIDAHGNPVYDRRLDEMGNVLERTQDAMLNNQKYQSRASARLARLRAKVAEAEANNRELENRERAASQTLLPRPRS